MEDGQNEQGRPLWKGPIFGGLYFLGGLVVAVIASWIGGWLSLPLWIMAVLLMIAGAWTALFTGFFLILAAFAKRTWRRPESPPET